MTQTGICSVTDEKCQFHSDFAILSHEYARFWPNVLLFLPILQYSLDIWMAPRYACPRQESILCSATNSSAMPLSARRPTNLNPRNNRPLPQSLWDVIERFG